MAKPDLRIHDESCASKPTSPEPTVRMKLAQIFPLLVHAHRHENVWLKDLADDDVLVTADLAEVIRAFETIVHEKRRA
jgi:hypothetical protein